MEYDLLYCQYGPLKIHITKERQMQSKAADLLERLSNRIDAFFYTFSKKIL